MQQQSEILLRVDKLAQILQTILIKQIKINHILQYCLFFKVVELSQGILINILCLAFRQEFEKNITNLAEYKEKYKDYKEIAGFVGQYIPKIIQLSAQDTLIIFTNTIHTQIYHYNNLMKNTGNLKLIETIIQECTIQQDEYQDNIFIILQNQPYNQLLFSEYQKIKNKFKSTQTFQLQLDCSIQLQLFTKYNDSTYILLTQSTLLIITINNDNCPIIRKIELPQLQGGITLYFYSQFQNENIMYLLIQSDIVTLQISTHQKQINNEIDLHFKITLNQIKALTLETIRKSFLLDLITALPSITEFSLWPSNDFEAIKYLLLQNLPIKGIGEMITCSIIYSLKYKPALVMGILKYSEYYCFLIQFPYIQLIRTIYEWLPGYRNLGHHYLNGEFSDEEIVWKEINRLCE